jgi:hypothetical protein
MYLLYQAISVVHELRKSPNSSHSRLIHFSILHLHLVSHITSIPLQSHFLVAHFPLHAQGFISDALSLFTGKAGLLNRDFRLATTCSFEGRSFPAKYCSTNDFGSTGRTSFAWTLAFLRVGYLYLRWTTSFKINSTYPIKIIFLLKIFFAPIIICQWLAPSWDAC